MQHLADACLNLPDSSLQTTSYLMHLATSGNKLPATAYLLAATGLKLVATAYLLAVTRYLLAVAGLKLTAAALQRSLSALQRVNFISPTREERQVAVICMLYMGIAAGIMTMVSFYSPILTSYFAQRAVYS